MEDVAPLIYVTIYSASAMARSMEALNTWSSVDRLAAISAPTLVLGGAHDVITSPPQARRIASRVPGAELRLFAESGHFPWIEEPAEFFECVDTWLHRMGFQP
jgi:pimeloyl-ACP methyl ester carboxylesterase